MQLDTKTAASGISHIARETVGSTNEAALALARTGERGPLWITARTQSAGRGRRGSAWVSQPGNLYATLLLTDPCAPERAPELSFVAALAVHDAVVELAPQLGAMLRVKWPNDLLLDGAKFSGTLIEGDGTLALAAAIGIGVNCVNHPRAVVFPATDLAAAGAAIGPDALFAALTVAMSLRLEQWARGAGFAAIRADWLARAAGLGEAIQVRVAGREVDGRFHGLDAAGRLLLQLPGGAMETIAAGEVFALGAGR